jgi:hypothetical protein
MAYTVKISRPTKPDIEYTLEGNLNRPIVLMNVFEQLDETIKPGEPLNFVVSVTEKN